MDDCTKVLVYGSFDGFAHSTELKNVFQMLETLTLEVLMQVNCQLVKLALEILR